VCDGMRGMFNLFSKYNVQMCQFHQKKIVLKYITNKPKLEASKELKSLMDVMFVTDKESFIGLFEEWYNKWKYFIKERKVNKNTHKSRYVHKRLRSAYMSVNRNMDYLWTWYDYIELNIPNTNNKLE